MDINNILNNVLQTNRAKTEEILDAIDALHSKNEEIAENALEKSGFIPEEGRSAILNWIKVSREARQNIKKQTLEGHDNLGRVLKAS